MSVCFFTLDVLAFDLNSNCDECQPHVLLTCVYVLLPCSAPVVGFKAVPSGDVGTNAWSTKENKKNKVESLVAQGVSEVDAQALASGQYTFYQVSFKALEIWAQSSACLSSVLDDTQSARCMCHVRLVAPSGGKFTDLSTVFLAERHCSC